MLKACQIDLVQDFILHLLKILFLKFYLILDRLDLFVEAIDFFFVDRDVLDLVAHKSTLLSLRQWKLRVATRFVSLFGVITCLLDPLLEVDDLVVNEVLVNLHFFLKILHLTLIDKLQDS